MTSPLSANTTLQHIKHISQADNNSGATTGTYYTTVQTVTFTVHLWTNVLPYGSSQRKKNNTPLEGCGLMIHNNKDTKIYI